MSKTKPMYYVYHIPKVKVGMTKDLGDRVFEQQGYLSRKQKASGIDRKS